MSAVHNQYSDKEFSAIFPPMTGHVVVVIYQTGIQLGLMKNSHNHLIKNRRLNLNGGPN
jgi:hypothetical protein